MDRGVVVKNRDSCLHIYMNGYRVGEIRRPAGGNLVLEYDAQWQLNPGGRPISLSLPLEKRVHRGAVVYNFFDNLLPDNPEIRTRIQRRFSCPTSHPFDLLSAIGADCVGALQLVVDESNMPPIRVVSAETLSDSQIENILGEYLSAPLGMARGHDEFRISIAGAQEKTALIRYKGVWCLPRRATPTSHILKLPIGVLRNQGIDFSNSCENEWFCMRIAKEFGLPTANVALRRFGKLQTLEVERFDRKWSSDGTWLLRLPQEDMCQALGSSPGLKYESDGGPGIVPIMDLLKRSRSAQGDRTTFMSSQVLFWLLAAIDGHGKNFSIRILPRGNYELCPLYDILSAYPLVSGKQVPAQKLKMAMALFGTRKKYYRFAQIQPRHFASTSQRVGFSPDEIRNLIGGMFEKLDEVLDRVCSSLPKDFPGEIAESIIRGMKSTRDRYASDI